MRHPLLLCIIILIPLTCITSQNGLNPIERNKDYYYESVMFIDGEKVFFTNDGLNSGIRDFWIDVINMNDERVTILNPKAISEWAMPFYYKREAENSILTGWLCPKGDSFSIVMTRYHPLSEKHDILQEVTRSGVFGDAASTKPSSLQNSEVVLFNIRNNGGGPSDIMMLVEIDQLGTMKILALERRLPNEPNTGIISTVHVMDMKALNDSTFLIRGFLDVGIGVVNRNLDILSIKGGVFDDVKTGERLGSASFGFGMEIMDDEIWAFGLFPNRGFNLTEPNLCVYHLEGDSVILDTLILYDQPEMAYGISGTSVKLGEQDAIICTNPYYGGVSWKTSFQSEIFLQRIINREEVWYTKYTSKYYIQVTDMILSDSCEITVVGRVYDYFSNGYLQGFYATFDCNGNILTSNVSLHEEEIINLYPNPASDQINVKTDYTGQINYRLSSIDGRCAREGELHNNSVDVSQIEEGVYILNILTESGAHSEKVVISR
ncbi:MAG: T9SS type A sorting domain-containing protein [Saprospiraceae bacterium]|nr:T9SS type A sorting domain-containing protein [Saprospiraceae bacterium]